MFKVIGNGRALMERETLAALITDFGQWSAAEHVPGRVLIVDWQNTILFDGDDYDLMNYFKGDTSYMLEGKNVVRFKTVTADILFDRLHSGCSTQLVSTGGIKHEGRVLGLSRNPSDPPNLFMVKMFQDKVGPVEFVVKCLPTT